MAVWVQASVGWKGTRNNRFDLRYEPPCAPRPLPSTSENRQPGAMGYKGNRRKRLQSRLLGDSMRLVPIVPAKGNRQRMASVIVFQPPNVLCGVPARET